MKTFTPRQLINQLKSGKWRKAREQLGRGEKSRCCLGVACEMAEIEWIYDGTDWREYGLPDAIHGYDIFERAFPWLTQAVAIKLSDLNDSSRGWGDVIEHLEVLDRKLKVKS